MSRTLFWYIMRDLLRIFIMTSMTLAGIMAFGGLLKPLMQYGLSGTQVAQMLAYFMPATQTYSLPIAALFATTVVYGRLSADNELTACRAAGVSYFTLAMPAFVLGLILAITSLAALSFVVPHYTLKVEKVAFASLADVIRKNIQRSHQISFSGQKIYAERAEILPKDPARPDDEVVLLHSPIFCLTEQVMDDTGKHKLNVPSEFFTAKLATIVIRQDPDQAEFLAHLDGGVRFPRLLEGSHVGGLGAAQVGPVPIPSLIRENTKFMNIRQLKELFKDPLRSRNIRQIYLDMTRSEQEQAFLEMVMQSLREGQEHAFAGTAGETMVLRIEGETRRRLQEGRLKLGTRGKPELPLTSASAARDIRLINLRNGEVRNTDEAKAVTLRVQSDLNSDRMRMEFQLSDVVVGMNPEAQTVRPRLPRPFSVAASASLLEIKSRGPEYYLEHGKRGSDDKLYMKLRGLQSGIAAEIHGRASFAVSCLILVTVGCALGMMFRTGNYLSAFALSVIPALLSIALTVTGQHVAEANPKNLQLGLAIVWSGNAIVLVLAVTLLGKLQRQ